MSPSRDRVVVEQRAVEQDPRKVRLGMRADAEAAGRRRTSTATGEHAGQPSESQGSGAHHPPAETVHGGAPRDRTPEHRAEEHARAADRRIHHAARRSPRERARRHDLPGRQAEDVPGLLREEVLAEDRPCELRLPVAERSTPVEVDRLDVPPLLLLAAAERVVEAPLEAVPLRLELRLTLDRDLLHVGQLVDEQLRDLASGLRPAAPALRDERGHRLLDRAAPLRPQLAERLEQPVALLERGGEGVEVPGDREVLTERAVPLGDVIPLADPVHERHAGPTCPAQDLHLGLVVAPEGLRAVHDVEDARAAQDGHEEAPLVDEVVGVGVRAHELLHPGGPLRGIHLLRAQPGEGARRVLEAGSVDQHEQRAAVDAHRIFADLGGGARSGVDPHRVVLGERRHDARLALVDAPDHREARDPAAVPRGHAGSPSGSTAT